MMLEMRIPEGKFGRAYLNLYDPEGRAHETSKRVAHSETRQKASVVISGDALLPGVWEIAPYATFRNQKKSSIEFQARFGGIDIPDSVDYFVPEGGGLEASIPLTNRFETPVKGAINATVRAWVRDESYDVEGAKYETDLVLPSGSVGATLSFELSPEDYNLFTDIAVNVVDSSGNVVAQSGFGARFLDVSFRGGPGSYTVEILGATARPESEPTWNLSLRETQRLATPIPLEVSGPEGSGVILYPGVSITLDTTMTQALPERPDGYDAQVELVFEDVLHRGPALTYRLVYVRQ